MRVRLCVLMLVLRNGEPDRLGCVEDRTGQDRTALLGVRGVRGTGEVDAALALAEALVEL